MAPEQFFAGHEEARVIFDAVRKLIETIGPTEVRVTKSQVALRRRTGFAFVWMPDMHLGDRGVPLVLTIGLRRRDGSPRWKEIVEPAPGRFTHHQELRSVDDVDEEFRGRLHEAWEAAGRRLRIGPECGGGMM